MGIDEKKIARINELYRRSKAEGLTDAEKQEQKLPAAQISYDASAAGVCGSDPRESAQPAG